MKHNQPSKKHVTGAAPGASGKIPPDKPEDLPLKTRITAVVPIAMLLAIMLALPMAMVGWGIRGWKEEKRSKIEEETENGQSSAAIPDSEGLREILEGLVETQWEEPVLPVPPSSLIRIEWEMANAEVATIVDTLAELQQDYPNEILNLTTEGPDEPTASYLISGPNGQNVLKKLAEKTDIGIHYPAEDHMIMLEINEKK